MEVLDHREQVYKALKRALAEDKARTNVLQISELGLVEMTRKRVRQDLRALLTQPCGTCRGTGVVKSDETLATEIYRAIQARAAAEAPAGEGREIVARVHPDLAAYIEREGRADLERLEAGLEVKVTVQAAPSQNQREDYEVRVR
jgi:ribonuclease G